MSILINAMSKFEKSRHPENIEIFRREIPEFVYLTDGLIELLWEKFSDQIFGARYMTINPTRLQEFKRWINNPDPVDLQSIINPKETENV